jgi:hypothetical protein
LPAAVFLVEMQTAGLTLATSISVNVSTTYGTIASPPPPVGRCRWTPSKPALKAPLVSAFEAIQIS